MALEHLVCAGAGGWHGYSNAKGVHVGSMPYVFTTLAVGLFEGARQSRENSDAEEAYEQHPLEVTEKEVCPQPSVAGQAFKFAGSASAAYGVAYGAGYGLGKML